MREDGSDTEISLAENDQREAYDYHHGRIELAVEITGQRRNLVPSIKEPMPAAP